MNKKIIKEWSPNSCFLEYPLKARGKDIMKTGEEIAREFLAKKGKN